MPDSTPALDALAAAGVPIDAIDEQKRAVLASLSDEETRVLVGIIEKMDAEVEGFGLAMGAQTAQLNPSLRPGLNPSGLPSTQGSKVPGIDPGGALKDVGGVFW